MAKWFYYNENDDKIEVTGGQLKGLAKAGLITPGTLVEAADGKKAPAKKVKGLTFVTAAQTGTVASESAISESESVLSESTQPIKTEIHAQVQPEPIPKPPVEVNPFAVSAPKEVNPFATAPPVEANPFTASVNPFAPSSPNADTIKKLNTYFKKLWIYMALAIPTCGITGILGIIYGFMLLYQLWKLVPSDIARTTPGKAVGFCFIPLFNLYWVFVAFKGLGVDMNESLRQRGIPYQVNEGLGLAYCILFIVNFITAYV